MKGSTSIFRSDGRCNGGTLRPLACELSPLQRSDGSALWKSGATSVLAAVYGPIAPHRASFETPYAAVISVIFNGCREYEGLLQTILEGCICMDQYSRCVIEVVLQTIRDDGSVLSCAIHATAAALMDAGILMKQLPLATSMTLSLDQNHPGDGKVQSVMLLDPNQEEEQNQTSLTIVTSNLEPDRVLGSLGSGKFSLAQLLECQETASRATPVILAFLRLAIEQKVVRQSKTLWAAADERIKTNSLRL